MSGTPKLYTLAPVFKIPQHLDLPACMYKMKNPVACVTNTTDHTDDEKEVLAGIMDKVKDILKQPLPELASLEARWDTVLKQLSELKQQITSVKKTISDVCRASGCPQLDSATLDNLKAFQGAVINANPSSPPYSLLFVKHLYKSSVPIVFSSHVHSTVSSLPDNVKCFTQPVPEVNNALKLTLIWKDDISDTELVMNPIKQIAIKGEVNILRFLGRSGLKLLQYPSEELLNTIQTDSILDVCHRLLHVRAQKERSSLYRSLNAKLGRAAYFGGDNINISDIAAWSSLKQINVNATQDLSQSMAKWYKRMEETCN